MDFFAIARRNPTFGTHDRLPDSLEAEAISPTMDKNFIFHSTADAFLVLSCIPDIASSANDPQLIRALEWALQSTHADSNFWRSSIHPLFRLQSATLWLLHTLVNRPGDSALSDFLSVIPYFTTKICTLVSQPHYSNVYIHEREEEHVRKRDEAFVGILLKLFGDGLDQWINDEQNHFLLRQ